jgi:hypothetical protein
MLDDNKRTHPVKIWLTEREYLDLCKHADQQDRKSSEAARVIVRRFMYGNIGVAGLEIHGANSPEGAAE